MTCNNPQQMVNEMIKKNPNLQGAWEQAQMLATQNKEQVINNLCKQKGISRDELISQAQQCGINIH